jgi:uncharacterized protein YjiS (DUF1127 family)
LLQCSNASSGPPLNAYVAARKTGRSFEMSRFSQTFRGLTEAYRAAQYRAVLSRLSDRQLADVGFSRDEIGYRALEMARGH